MPQIGWFEILIIVVIAILVIGPKDFPVVLRKIGGSIGSFKRYFSNIQDKINNLDQTLEEETKVGPDDKFKVLEVPSVNVSVMVRELKVTLPAFLALSV